MKKHTLGPWRIGDAGTAIFGPRVEGPIPAETIATNIAKKEDAQLIAVSPTMLLVLEELVYMASDGTEFSWDAFNSVVRAAQHVVEKARGELK